MISFIATIITFLSLLGATGYVCKDQLNNMVQQVLHGVTNQQQPTIEDFILLRQFAPIELMLHKDAPITLQHYRQLALMEKLESDPQKKAIIITTLNLVEHYLQEQGILSKENLSNMKRPVLTSKAAVASSVPQEQTISISNVNVKFLEAVKENNIPLMEQLQSQGANPNCRINCLQPLEIAIAHGHIQATEWLLAQPITVTTEHTESSQRFIYIIQSNIQEKLARDQEILNQIEIERSRLRHAIRSRLITPMIYEARRKEIGEKLRSDLSKSHLDLTFTTAETEDDTYEQKLEKQKVAYQEELAKRAQVTKLIQQHLSRDGRR